MTAMPECGHVGIDLPDVLPDGVVAALARPIDPSAADAARKLARPIVTALWAAHFRNVHLGGADHRTACAVLHRHPDLVATSSRSTIPLLCVMARSMWPETPARTELGLAERVAGLHGADLAYTADIGWHVWTGARWEVDQTGTVATSRVIDTVKGLLLDEVQGDEEEQASARGFAMRSQAARVIRAGLDLTRAQPGITVPAEAWDAAPHLLPTTTGVVELAEGEAKCREHRRGDRLTRITRAGFRPEADRSVWDRFVAEVLPDPAVRQRMQRLTGYALFGENRERRLVILLGPSTSGKTTYCETVAHVLGDYGGTFDLGLFRGSREGGAPRADLVAALPRRLIHTTEASDRWELHADAIKRLTGGDTLTARALYARTAVQARPAFVPFVATNSAPRVVGADDALWRRLEVIPFGSTIAREDPDLGRRMRDEHADAVLAWAVDGWVAYSRFGLGEVPEACAVAAQRLRADLSLIDAWLADETEADEHGSAPAAELAETWHVWCIRNRVPEREQISAIALGKALTARGYGTGFTGSADARVRVRTGLRLIVPPPDAAPKARGLRVVE